MRKIVCPIDTNTEVKAKQNFRGINFTLISVSMVFVPNFDPNFARFFEEFSCFVSWENGDQKEFAKNPRHFSMQNRQANPIKKFCGGWAKCARVCFFSRKERKGAQKERKRAPPRKIYKQPGLKQPGLGTTAAHLFCRKSRSRHFIKNPGDQRHTNY